MIESVLINDRCSELTENRSFWESKYKSDTKLFSSSLRPIASQSNSPVRRISSDPDPASDWDLAHLAPVPEPSASTTLVITLSNVYFRYELSVENFKNGVEMALVPSVKMRNFNRQQERSPVNVKLVDSINNKNAGRAPALSRFPRQRRLRAALPRARPATR